MMSRDFHLKFPQWQNGNWVVGLGDYLFKGVDVLHVYCDYRKKNGSKLWDSFKYCTEDFAKKFPLEPLKKDPRVKLYRIPFGQLETFHESYMDKINPIRKPEPIQEPEKVLLNKRESEYIGLMMEKRKGINWIEYFREIIKDNNAPVYRCGQRYLIGDGYIEDL